MTGTDALDALANALQTLAEALEQTILDLADAGSSAAGRCRDVTTAKTRIETAAAAINDASATAKLDGGAAGQLETLAVAIEGKAEQIAQQEANVARIAGIGSGVLTLATDVAAGNLAGALASAHDVATLLT